MRKVEVFLQISTLFCKYGYGRRSKARVRGGLKMAEKKKKKHYSGIGGQAVLEGVMMKNGDRYAVAVRKPDGAIEVKTEEHTGVWGQKAMAKVPFVRGIFNFVDSLVLGMRTLTWSAEFYEEEPKAEEKAPGKAKALSERLVTGLTVVFSLLMAVGIFIVLPYLISGLFSSYVRNASLLAILEGVLRILIFLGYVLAISAMKDIRRVYMYHGAEHKCINCLEKGRELTVKNVRKSSRQHRRCGTSFLLFVMLISVILFMFIRVSDPVQRLALRLALIPVIAGISYEIIRLAGRYDNILVRIISAPGMLLQRLTTREPDDDMIEVAIASVEAVFDWKAFLREEFGYDIDAWKQQRKDGKNGVREAEDQMQRARQEMDDAVQKASERLRAAGEAIRRTGRIPVEEIARGMEAAALQADAAPEEETAAFRGDEISEEEADALRADAVSEEEVAAFQADAVPEETAAFQTDAVPEEEAAAFQAGAVPEEEAAERAEMPGSVSGGEQP